MKIDGQPKVVQESQLIFTPPYLELELSGPLTKQEPNSLPELILNPNPQLIEESRPKIMNNFGFIKAVTKTQNP